MKLTVNYGTIKGMEVEIEPTMNCIDLLRSWVKSHIKYMTVDCNCICNTEVLVNSIGASFSRKALIEGLGQRLTGNALSVFVEHMTDENWRFEVIRQREGERAAFTDRHGAEIAQRFADMVGFDN